MYFLEDGADNMTILIYDTVGTSNFMTLYRDSDDPKRFYYVPQFSGISTYQNGKLKFGARLFPNNGNGIALYNFACTADIPTDQLTKALSDLNQQYGPNVRLTMITPDSDHPTLKPITNGIYKSITCQGQGVDLYTDLACSFVIPESLEPGMSQFFQSATAWAGEIDFAVRTQKTAFKWNITANWHRIQEHFRAETSVHYWYVSANLSYETQKLIENDPEDRNGGWDTKSEGEDL
jgi:LmbE family N-acetylglucosaminyl deacetylase